MQMNFRKRREQELLTRLDLDDWRQLNQKYYLHNFNRGFNGSTRAIKQIVKEVSSVEKYDRRVQAFAWHATALS
jgi:hypothetical protein